jgi:hypothetical protein
MSDRAPPPGAPRIGRTLFTGFAPPLQVVGFIATRRGDPERGPLVRMRPDDALVRLLTDGELVRVLGPRRSEFAELVLDESLPRGGIVVRDLAGVAVTEIVRVLKVDLDAPVQT